MNQQLLERHVKAFLAKSRKDPDRFSKDSEERLGLVRYYRSFTADRMAGMGEEDIYEYLSRLWAMRIWGNKHYVIDRIISNNGLQRFQDELGSLIWGGSGIAERWNVFRGNIKGMGPAMISEILCKTHPEDFMLWNRRAYVGLRYLEVEGLPLYDYQLTGEVYEHLCAVAREVAQVLDRAGFDDTSLLAVDYFIWDELQVEENLSKLDSKEKKEEPKEVLQTPTELEFVHNDIRDKLGDIGQWLGFESRIEQKVSEGARVDTVWEATIGNMGRVIYVFEVQTKGSIDSLIVNLLKSLNNPAVQGVVAVSDKKQLERVCRHAMDVKELKDKLRYWDYEEVLRIHESLEFVNATINELGLVPQGFY